MSQLAPQAQIQAQGQPTATAGAPATSTSTRNYSSLPSMSFHFSDRVALVTGASAGIGAATAVAFAKAGAHVVLADCTIKAGEIQVQVVQRAADEAASKAGRSSAGRVIFIPCDVSNGSQVTALFERIDREFGRLDFAFNNAGIEGMRAPTGSCTEQNWDRVVGINLKGVWLCMQHEIALMSRPFKSSGNGGGVASTSSVTNMPWVGGSIVNNSSVAGLIGFEGIPAYSSAKHGLLGLTKTSALEYAKQRVRINAVCPGFIHTAMIDRFSGGDPAVMASFCSKEPVGRMGTPEEVAAVVLFLCADEAAFITGHALAVDGGYVAQ